MSDNKYGEPWNESTVWNMVSTKDDSVVIYNADDMNEPYRSRAIAAVNSCAGIDDPQAAITSAKAAIQRVLERVDEDEYSSTVQECRAALALLSPAK